jgi:hypothetical protein
MIRWPKIDAMEDNAGFGGRRKRTPSTALETGSRIGGNAYGFPAFLQGRSETGVETNPRT